MENLPPEDRPPVAGSRRLPRGVWWAIALAIVVLAAAAYQAVGSPGGSTAPSGSAAGDTPVNPLQRTMPDLTGKPMPDAVLTRFDRTTGSISDYRGRPLVINFWSVNCVPCRTEMPDLERAHQRYGDRVAFLGIDTADGEELARSQASQLGVTYDLALDPEGSIFTSIGAVGLPTTVLVRADGTVARAHTAGAVKPSDLQTWIEQDLLS